MTGMAVTVTDVAKRFGSIKALDTISLEIAEGEVFAIIGPIGAGQTRLVNLITGILAPDGSVVSTRTRTFCARSRAARTFTC